MNVLQDRLRANLQAMQQELDEWVAEAPFLADEMPIHVKIGERVRVLLMLQQVLLESIPAQLECDREAQSTSLGRLMIQALGTAEIADFGKGETVAAYRAQHVENTIKSYT